jgi:transcription termination factor NusA
VLAKKGIRTVKDLANVPLEELMSIPGFSEARASAVRAAAVLLLPAEKKANKKKKHTKKKKKKK